MFQSTHSLRSATVRPVGFPYVAEVSIHALLAECDLALARLSDVGIPFQSTHSLRSATADYWRSKPGLTGFNPRTPCGVRQLGAEEKPQPIKFQSTHSLRSATH